MKINYKKAFLAGLITFLIDMIISNILWMNPYIAGTFKKFEGHASIKSMEYFGGLGNWLLLTFTFGFCLTAFFIILYIILYKGIPGNNWIKKGLFFGIMIAIIKAVPEAFNQWMIFVYPNILIILQLLNTIIGLILFGIYLAFFIKIFKVIEE